MPQPGPLFGTVLFDTVLLTLFSSQPQAYRFASQVRLRLTAKHYVAQFSARMPIDATRCSCFKHANNDMLTNCS